MISKKKALYYADQLDEILSRFGEDEQETLELELEAIGNVDVLVAMRWAQGAWASVTCTTISNCWRHTEVLDEELLTLAFNIKRRNVCSRTTVNLEDNHQVSKRTYGLYYCTRAAWSEEMVDTINSLRQQGLQKKSIQRYIVEQSSLSPTLEDIANLIVKLKKREKGSKPPIE
uniref:AlNc14C496G11927 protein n=1 Tax=Albugo laibachii Nc14 TaxID=890382 RepID=F0X0I3_9STRA|nr:AlNc14C496G11927 [Albugo laibachii Nc14]|eukprot:CCA27273.1 AlNc14C496G11927 [Albugo laibachii Nc14]